MNRRSSSNRNVHAPEENGERLVSPMPSISSVVENIPPSYQFHPMGDTSAISSQFKVCVLSVHDTLVHMKHPSLPLFNLTSVMQTQNPSNVPTSSRGAAKTTLSSTTYTRPKPTSTQATSRLTTQKGLINAEKTSKAGPTVEIIEMMKLEDFTHQTDCNVPLHLPIFEPSTASLEWKEYDAGDVLHSRISFRNRDTVPRRMRIEHPDSPYFTLSPPQNSRGGPIGDSRIAPGESVYYTVTFHPPEVDDYRYTLLCISEREKFVIPVKALGKRGKLTFPPSVHFPAVTTKTSSRRVIVVRNIGTRGSEFSLQLPPNSPWTISPMRGFVDIGKSMPLSITFTAPREGTMQGQCLIELVTDEISQVMDLVGSGQDVPIYLEQDAVTFANTFVTLDNRMTLSLFNNSDFPVHFEWLANATDTDESEQRHGAATELEHEYIEQLVEVLREYLDEAAIPGIAHHPSLALPPYGSSLEEQDENDFALAADGHEDDVDSVIAMRRLRETSRNVDPLRGEVGVPSVLKQLPVACSATVHALKRKYWTLRQRKLDERTSFNGSKNGIDGGGQFHISPAAGTLWARSSITLDLAFAPVRKGYFEATAWLEVGGQSKRLPLLLRGEGLGPRLTLLYDFVDTGRLTQTSVHKYSITLMNKGEIPATWNIHPVATPESEIADSFAFEPSEGTLPPQTTTTIDCILTVASVGAFKELFNINVQGTDETLIFTFQGFAVPPSLEVDVDQIEFGHVAHGFSLTRSFQLFNTSDVPIPYQIRVPKDGALVPLHHPYKARGSGPGAYGSHGLYDGARGLLDVPPEMVHRVEFTSTPPEGVIFPGESTTITTVFSPLTPGLDYGQAGYSLLVTIPGCRTGTITLPILAVAAAPVLQVSSPTIDWGSVYLNHPSTRTLTLVNPSLLLPVRFEVLDQAPHELITATMTTTPKEEFIPPGHSLDLEIQLTAKRLGPLLLPLCIRVPGMGDPSLWVADEGAPDGTAGIVLQVDVQAQGRGPQIVPEPQLLEWGPVPCLLNTRYPSPLMVKNTGPIPALVQCALRRGTHFTLIDSDGIAKKLLEPFPLEPGESAPVVLSVHPNDTSPCGDELLLHVDDSDTITIPLLARGTGSVLYVSVMDETMGDVLWEGPAKLLDVVDMGHKFTTALRKSGSQQASQLAAASTSGKSTSGITEALKDYPRIVTIVLGNRGNRPQFVSWTNMSRKAMEMQIRKAQKEGLPPPEMEPSPINRSCYYHIEPSHMTLKPGETGKFTLISTRATPGVLEEEFELTSKADNELRGVTVAKPRFTAVLEPPLVSFDPPYLFFSHWHSHEMDNPLESGELPSVTQEVSLALKNESTLPLEFTLNVPPPFSLSAYELSLLPGQLTSLDVYFDPLATPQGKAMQSYTLNSAISTTYLGHTRKDVCKLNAEAHFPNLTLATTAVDFGTVLEGTVSVQMVLLTNHSQVPVDFRWSFFQPPPSAELLSDATSGAGKAKAARGGHDKAHAQLNRLAIADGTSGGLHMPGPETVFDILPTQGVIAPGGSLPVQFSFTAKKYLQAMLDRPGAPEKETSAWNTLAVCEVAGGPEYKVALQGQAGSGGFVLEPTSLNLGAFVWDNRAEGEITLRNTGSLSYTWTASNAKASRSWVVNVSPSSGTLAPDGKQRIKIHLRPGAPGVLNEIVTVTVGHFAPVDIAIHAIATFPCLSMSIPRDPAPKAIAHPVPGFSVDLSDWTEAYNAALQLLQDAPESALFPLENGPAAAASSAIGAGVVAGGKSPGAPGTAPGAQSPDRRRRSTQFGGGDTATVTGAASVAGTHADHDDGPVFPLDVRAEVEAMCTIFGKALLKRWLLEKNLSAATKAAVEDYQAFLASQQANGSESGYEGKEDLSETNLHKESVPKYRYELDGTVPLTPAVLDARSALKDCPMPYRLFLSQYTIDFGPVVVGNVKRRVFHIMNSGSFNLSLSIDPNFLHGTGITIEPKKFTRIPQGEVATVTVTFQPTEDMKRLNPDTGELLVCVPLLVPKGAPALLVLKATVTQPDVTITPPECFLDFGTIQLQNERTMSFMIMNPTRVPSSWSIGAPFLVTPEQAKDRFAFRFDENSGTLPPGGRILIKAHFAPTEARSYNLSFPIRVQQGGKPKILTLTGKGEDLDLVFSYSPKQDIFELTNTPAPMAGPLAPHIGPNAKKLHLGVSPPTPSSRGTFSNPLFFPLGPQLPGARCSFGVLAITNTSKRRITVFSLDFDKVGQAEDEIIQLLPSSQYAYLHDGKKRLPSRGPGESLSVDVIKAAVLEKPDLKNILVDPPVMQAVEKEKQRRQMLEEAIAAGKLPEPELTVEESAAKEATLMAESIANTMDPLYTVPQVPISTSNTPRHAGKALDIVVVGPPGSGVSSASQMLGKKMGLPVITIDSAVAWARAGGGGEALARSLREAMGLVGGEDKNKSNLASGANAAPKQDGAASAAGVSSSGASVPGGNAATASNTSSPRKRKGKAPPVVPPIRLPLHLVAAALAARALAADSGSGIIIDGLRSEFLSGPNEDPAIALLDAAKAVRRGILYGASGKLHVVRLDVPTEAHAARQSFRLTDLEEMISHLETNYGLVPSSPEETSSSSLQSLTGNSSGVGAAPTTGATATGSAAPAKDADGARPESRGSRPGSAAGFGSASDDNLVLAVGLLEPSGEPLPAETRERVRLEAARKRQNAMKTCDELKQMLSAFGSFKHDANAPTQAATNQLSRAVASLTVPPTNVTQQRAPNKTPSPSRDVQADKYTGIDETSTTDIASVLPQLERYKATALSIPVSVEVDAGAEDVGAIAAKIMEKLPPRPPLTMPTSEKSLPPPVTSILYPNVPATGASGSTIGRPTRDLGTKFRLNNLSTFVEALFLASRETVAEPPSSRGHTRPVSSSKPARTPTERTRGQLSATASTADAAQQESSNLWYEPIAQLPKNLVPFLAGEDFPYPELAFPDQVLNTAEDKLRWTLGPNETGFALVRFASSAPGAFAAPLHFGIVGYPGKEWVVNVQGIASYPSLNPSPTSLFTRPFLANRKSDTTVLTRKYALNHNMYMFGAVPGGISPAQRKHMAMHLLTNQPDGTSNQPGGAGAGSGGEKRVPSRSSRSNTPAAAASGMSGTAPLAAGGSSSSSSGGAGIVLRTPGTASTAGYGPSGRGGAGRGGPASDMVLMDNAIPGVSPAILSGLWKHYETVDGIHSQVIHLTNEHHFTTSVKVGFAAADITTNYTPHQVFNPPMPSVPQGGTELQQFLENLAPNTSAFAVEPMFIPKLLPGQTVEITVWTFPPSAPPLTSTPTSNAPRPTSSSATAKKGGPSGSSSKAGAGSSSGDATSPNASANTPLTHTCYSNLLVAAPAYGNAPLTIPVSAISTHPSISLSGPWLIAKPETSPPPTPAKVKGSSKPLPRGSSAARDLVIAPPVPKLDFERQLVGHTSQLTFSIENSSLLPLHWRLNTALMNASFRPQDASPTAPTGSRSTKERDKAAALAEPPQLHTDYPPVFSCNCDSGVLEPGQTAPVTVTFFSAEETIRAGGKITVEYVYGHIGFEGVQAAEVAYVAASNPEALYPYLNIDAASPLLLADTNSGALGSGGGGRPSSASSVASKAEPRKKPGKESSKDSKDKDLPPQPPVPPTVPPFVQSIDIEIKGEAYRVCSALDLTVAPAFMQKQQQPTTAEVPSAISASQTKPGISSRTSHAATAKSRPTLDPAHTISQAQAAPLFLLDFGDIRAHEVVKKLFPIKNKGKYPTVFRVSLHSPATTNGSPFAKVPMEMLSVHPMECVLVPGGSQDIEVSLCVGSAMRIRGAKCLTLYAHDQQTDKIVEEFPVAVSAQVHFSQWEVSPAKTLLFGPVLVNTKIVRTFTIKNTGHFPFFFQIAPAHSHIDNALLPITTGQQPASWPLEAPSGTTSLLQLLDSPKGRRSNSRPGTSHDTVTASYSTSASPVAARPGSGRSTYSSTSEAEANPFEFSTTFASIAPGQSRQIQVSFLSSVPRNYNSNYRIHVTGQNTTIFTLDMHQLNRLEPITYHLSAENISPAIPTPEKPIIPIQYTGLAQNLKFAELHQIWAKSMFCEQEVVASKHAMLSRPLEDLYLPPDGAQAPSPTVTSPGTRTLGKVPTHTTAWNTKPYYALAEQLFSFGTIAMHKFAGGVTQRFNIVNPTTVPVTVNAKINTPNSDAPACFTLGTETFTLLPRESYFLPVTYAPTSRGIHSASITLSVQRTPEEGPLNVTFGLEGEAVLPSVAVIEPLPASTNASSSGFGPTAGSVANVFGVVPLGTIQSKSLILKNTTIFPATMTLEMDPTSSFNLVCDPNNVTPASETFQMFQFETGVKQYHIALPPLGSVSLSSCFSPSDADIFFSSTAEAPPGFVKWSETGDAYYSRSLTCNVEGNPYGSLKVGLYGIAKTQDITIEGACYNDGVVTFPDLYLPPIIESPVSQEVTLVLTNRCEAPIRFSWADARAYASNTPPWSQLTFRPLVGHLPPGKQQVVSVIYTPDLSVPAPHVLPSDVPVQLNVSRVSYTCSTRDAVRSNRVKHYATFAENAVAAGPAKGRKDDKSKTKRAASPKTPSKAAAKGAKGGKGAAAATDDTSNIRAPRQFPAVPEPRVEWTSADLQAIAPPETLPLVLLSSVIESEPAYVVVQNPPVFQDPTSTSGSLVEPQTLSFEAELQLDSGVPVYFQAHAEEPTVVLTSPSGRAASAAPGTPNARPVSIQKDKKKGNIPRQMSSSNLQPMVDPETEAILSTSSVAFKPTSMYATRVVEVGIKNTSKFSLPFHWMTKGISAREVSTPTRQRTVRKASMASIMGNADAPSGPSVHHPFKITPSIGTLAPGEVAKLEVSFCPETQGFLQDQAALFVASHPVPVLTLPLSGEVERPLVHIDIPHNTYLETRNASLEGPSGIPGEELPNDIRVLQVKTIGCESKATVKVNVRNTSDAPFDWKVQPASGVGAGGHLPIRCLTPQGRLSPNRSTDLVFEYAPIRPSVSPFVLSNGTNVIAENEGFFNFSIVGQSVSLPLLVVGVTLEPRVSFDRPSIQHRALAGEKHTYIAHLRNRENIPYNFTIETGGAPPEILSQFLTVRPRTGKIAPNGFVPIEVTVNPREGQMALYMQARIPALSAPLHLSVLLEGHEVKAQLEYISPEQPAATPTPAPTPGRPSSGSEFKKESKQPEEKRIPISVESPLSIDLGHLEIGDVVTRRFVLKNTGIPPLDFTWDVSPTTTEGGGSGISGARALLATQRTRVKPVVGPGSTRVAPVPPPPVVVTPAVGRIPSGGEQEVILTFAPKGDVNFQSKVTCTIPGMEKFLVTVGGEAKAPALEVTPAVVNLGTVFCPPLQSPSPFKISSMVQILSKEAGRVLALSWLASETVSADSLSLSPGASHMLPIEWSPMVPGKLSEAVELMVNGQKGPVVHISGEAVPLLLSLVDPSQKHLSLGSITPGVPVQRTFKLVNRSVRPVELKLGWGGLERLECYEYLTIHPPVLNLSPREAATITVGFNCPKRLAAFSVPLVAIAEHVTPAPTPGRVCSPSAPIPITTVVGATSSVAVALDRSLVSFNKVWVGSSVSRDVLLINSGEKETSFHWNLPQGSDITISPVSGTLNSGASALLTMTYKPKKLGPLQIPSLSCAIEGQAAPLIVTCTGEGAPLPKPDDPPIAIQAHVLEAAAHTITLPPLNPSSVPITVYPIINHAYYSVPEKLVIPPDERHEPTSLTVIYAPRTQTRALLPNETSPALPEIGQTKHKATLLIPTPNGSGHVVEFDGTATSALPTPITCRLQSHISNPITINVRNPWPINALFGVSVPSQAMDALDGVLNMPSNLEVPPLSTRPLPLTFLPHKTGVQNLPVKLTALNVGNEEFVYKVSMEVSQGSLTEGSYTLTTPVFVPVSRTISIPVPRKVAQSGVPLNWSEPLISHPCVKVHFHKYSSGNETVHLVVEFSPIMPTVDGVGSVGRSGSASSSTGARKDGRPPSGRMPTGLDSPAQKHTTVTINSPVLGVFKYNLTLVTLPPVPAAPLSIHAPLGSTSTSYFTFTHPLASKVNYHCKVTPSDAFSTIPSLTLGGAQPTAEAGQQSPASGSKATATPTRVGTVPIHYTGVYSSEEVAEATLTIAPEGSQMPSIVVPIRGITTPPTPKGPLKLPDNGALTIPFTSPLPGSHEFCLTFVPELFQAANADTFKLNQKSTQSIQVKITPPTAGTTYEPTVSGSMTVTCTSVSPPIQWVYYLTGNTPAPLSNTMGRSGTGGKPPIGARNSTPKR